MKCSLILSSLFAVYAEYQEYPAVTCWAGHGGVEIDSDSTAPSGLSAESCEARCDDDFSCTCVAFRPSDGKCWKRSACIITDCGQDSNFNTYVKQAAPSDRLGSIIVIGDWGHDPSVHGNIYSDTCQNNVAALMDATMQQQGDVKFIVNVGDSFYPGGVSSPDDPQWDSKWRSKYSDRVRSVPWYSVYGNHDLHQDPGSCNDGFASAAQGNSDITNLNKFYMPDWSWNKEHPELQLEVIAMELNTYQSGWNHNIPASQQSFGDCQYTPCADTCKALMRQRSDAAFALFKKRKAASAQKNLLVFSHYPTDYFWDHTSGDASADFISDLSDASTHHIEYFGGHRHNVDQTSTASIAPNNNWLSGGGGGWGCDGSQQGFVLVEIAADGTMTSKPLLVDQGQCCNRFEMSSNQTVPQFV